MKAAVWTAYGGPEVFAIRELPDPSPGDGEILVQVRATTVTAGEVEMRRFAFRNVLSVPLRLFFGVFRPRGNRVLGQELAGEVVAVGTGVTQFDVGARVFLQTGFRFGGQAELALASADGMVARIPDGVSYEEATTLPTGGQYALYFTRRVGIQPGDSVLVNGAAGSIGTYAIQLAKHSGAHVTAVDRGDKATFLEDLGADETIDHEEGDFTRNLDSYDLILDVIDKSSYPVAAPSLKPGGTYLHTDLSAWAAVRRGVYRSEGGRRAKMVPEAAEPGDLDLLAGMLASGDLRAVIDRVYGLEDIVAAHRHAESGDKRGHIDLSV